MKKIVLIEDDCDLYSLLQYNLEKEGFQMTGSKTGKGAIDLCRNFGPDLILLDLNMPRKSGFECLLEIKLIDKLKDLPVIIFSTSLDMEVVDLLYRKGAHYYIRKPGQYGKLKKVILEAVTLTLKNKLTQPTRDKFILHP